MKILSLKGLYRGAALVPLLFLVLGVLSCRSLPGPFSGAKSWSSAVNSSRTANLRFLGVSVEKAGGGPALEKEIAAVVPLIFWERGYYFCPGDQRADYVVEVQVREREYAQGWKTKRSLALEIRLWREQGEDPRIYQSTPLAASQMIFLGKKTFSSSRQLNRTLRTAVNKSLWALHHKRSRTAGTAGEAGR